MELTHLLRTREAGIDAHRKLTQVPPRTFQRHVTGLSCWVPRLKRVRVLKGHRGCVNTIQWSPNGDFLISGSDDTKLKVWDMSRLEKKPVTLTPGHGANIFCAHFLPMTNEEQVVSCGADGNIIVTHLPSAGSDERARVRHLFTCHGDMVNKIVVDPNGPYVFYTCGDDGTVRRFDRRERHECQEAGEPCEDNVFIDLTQGDKYTSRTVGLNALSIDPSSGLQIAAAGSDPFIRVYDVRRPTEAAQVFRPSWHSEVERRTRRVGSALYMPYPHVTSLAFDRTGAELLASYGGDYVYLLRLVAAGDSASASAERSGAPPTPVDRMDLESPLPAPVSTEMEDEGDGDATGAVVPSRVSPKRRRSVAEDDDDDDNEEEEEDDEEKEDRGDEDGKDDDDGDDDDDDDEDKEEEEDYDDEKGGEENGSQDENEDEDDDDDDDDDDDSLPWEMDDEDDEQDRSLEEDPRLRHPEVRVDYERQWKGHLNVRTIKEVNFFGPCGEFIVSGSDDGHAFLWDRHTGALAQVLVGDGSIVNCVQGHPLGHPTLAVSGIDHDIKLFMPVARHRGQLDPDHVQRIINKNTRTLEEGRSRGAFTFETLQQLAGILDEQQDETEIRPNCAMS